MVCILRDGENFIYLHYSGTIFVWKNHFKKLLEEEGETLWTYSGKTSGLLNFCTYDKEFGLFPRGRRSKKESARPCGGGVH